MLRPWLRLLSETPAWAWLALGLALRVALALKAGNGYVQADETGFASAATRLVETGTLPASAPVPALLSGLGYLLVHPTLLGPRLLQALIGVATAWVIGNGTARLTGSLAAGRLALMLSCVYPFFVYYSALLMSETPYVLLSFSALALLGVSIAERRAGAAAAGGLLLGLAALTRTEAAPVALLVFAVMALAAGKDRRAWRRLGAAALLWSLPLLGWAARNKAVSGAFTLDAHGGVTLLHGTVFFDANEVDTQYAQQRIESSELWKRAQALPERERDAYLRAEAFRWMADHPHQVAKQWFLKFISFWRAYPRLDKNYPEHEGANPAAGAPRWALTAASLLFEPWLIVLGLAGLWRHRGRRELWPPMAFLLGTMGIHVLVVSQMRYRLPVMPVLMLGCALLAAKELQSAKR